MNRRYRRRRLRVRMQRTRSERADSPALGGEQKMKTCPSRACEVGVHLLGVMTESGRLAFVSPQVRVDAGFVSRAKASANGRPEQRFRFSGPCIEDGCPQWTGDRCAVADVVISEVRSAATDRRRLPACAIRRTCRWYAQRGPAACAVCPEVVADNGGTGTYRSLTAETEESVGRALDALDTAPDAAAAFTRLHGHLQGPRSKVRNR